MTALTDHVRTTRPAVQVDRRPSGPGDLPFLRLLFTEARDDLLLLPDDTRSLIVDMQFRAQQHRRRTQHPTARCELLLAAGEAVGHLVLDGGVGGTVADAVDDAVGDLHLVDLAVRSSHRGRGVGGAVLAAVAAQADATGRGLRLRVWSGNGAARRLAARHGFTVTASRAGYDEMRRCPTVQNSAPVATNQAS